MTEKGCQAGTQEKSIFINWLLLRLEPVAKLEFCNFLGG
jgi:hypothetical protein